MAHRNDLFKKRPLFTRTPDIMDYCCPIVERKLRNTDVTRNGKKPDILPCCFKIYNQSIQPPSNVSPLPIPPACNAIRMSVNAGQLLANGGIYFQNINQGDDITFADLTIVNTGAVPLSISNISCSGGVSLFLPVVFPIVLAPGASTGAMAGYFITNTLPLGTTSFTTTTLASSSACANIVHTFRVDAIVGCAAPSIEEIKINGTTYIVPALVIPSPISAGVGGTIPLDFKFVNPSPLYDMLILNTRPTQLVFVSSPIAGITYQPILPLAQQTVPVSSSVSNGTIGGTITVAPSVPAGLYEVDIFLYYTICTTEVPIATRVQINVV